eukprot:652296-Pyramimonas_sp.AAC.1
MVSEYCPRSGGASVNGWEGHVPDKSHGIRRLSSLRRGLPGWVRGARNLINQKVSEYYSFIHSWA